MAGNSANSFCKGSTHLLASTACQSCSAWPKPGPAAEAGRTGHHLLSCAGIARHIRQQQQRQWRQHDGRPQGQPRVWRFSCTHLSQSLVMLDTQGATPRLLTAGPRLKVMPRIKVALPPGPPAANSESSLDCKRGGRRLMIGRPALYPPTHSPCRDTSNERVQPTKHSWRQAGLAKLQLQRSLHARSHQTASNQAQVPHAPWCRLGTGCTSCPALQGTASRGRWCSRNLWAVGTQGGRGLPGALHSTPDRSVADGFDACRHADLRWAHSPM